MVYEFSYMVYTFSNTVRNVLTFMLAERSARLNFKKPRFLFSLYGLYMYYTCINAVL